MTEQAQPGRLVGGRYRLVDRLGAGGMGRVWRAHDQRLGTDVAVKEVSLPFMLSDQQLAERLSRAEREARNTVRLRDQPGIVTVHDVVIDDDVPWIVMQLVKGCSLDEHLRDHGPLTVENTAKVADTMLRALAAAHAAGIVHRDVKPANVLLADDGRVLLTDFGIARHEGDSSLTMTGAVVGSAEYLAPERARADEAGPPADLFSLGVTLYQAVEGISPFRRDSPTATMTAVLFEQPPPPKKAGRLTALIGALLAKDPGQRPSVQTALTMLNENGSGTGPSATPAPAPVPATTAAVAPTPYLASETPAMLSLSGSGSGGTGTGITAGGKGNGVKVALAVAAVVAVSGVAVFAVTHFSHSGTPQASTTTSSSSNTPTPTDTPTTSQPTSATTPAASDSQDPTSSDSTPPAPDPVKAGCSEALRDLKAFNDSNPAATHDKTIEINADRKLASNLAADAFLATDPAVKTAIQNEADSWNTFADDYANNDPQGMAKTIPLTKQYITDVNNACNT